MVDRGEALGVDLYELWLAGWTYLPEVADHLRATLADLESVAADDHAFLRPDQFGGGPHGPAYRHLVGLRDQLGLMLLQTSDILKTVSTVLVLTAREYADADDAARAKFLSLLSPFEAMIAGGRDLPPFGDSVPRSGEVA